MDYICDEFIPAYDGAEDDYFDTYIEEERAAFRSDWFSYEEYCNS